MTLTNEELRLLYEKKFFLANDNKIVVITTEKLAELGIEIEESK